MIGLQLLTQSYSTVTEIEWRVADQPCVATAGLLDCTEQSQLANQTAEALDSVGSAAAAAAEERATGSAD